MYKIQRLELTRIPSLDYKFDCTADVRVDNTSPPELQELRGYDLLNATQIMELVPPSAYTRIVDFENNVDDENELIAKTHNIILVHNGQLKVLGRISVRDGNYPPPNNFIPEPVSYNQPDLSDKFTVEAMSFTRNGSTYNVCITLKIGNGSIHPIESDKITVSEAYEANGISYNALLIGIENHAGITHSTLIITGTMSLDLTTEALAILIVPYENGGYNVDCDADGFMKKGVIQLIDAQ